MPLEETAAPRANLTFYYEALRMIAGAAGMSDTWHSPVACCVACCFVKCPVNLAGKVACGQPRSSLA
jgi:hypothetical protein